MKKYPFNPRILPEYPTTSSKPTHSLSAIIIIAAIAVVFGGLYLWIAGGQNRQGAPSTQSQSNQYLAPAGLEAVSAQVTAAAAQKPPAAALKTASDQVSKARLSNPPLVK